MRQRAEEQGTSASDHPLIYAEPTSQDRSFWWQKSTGYTSIYKIQPFQTGTSTFCLAISSSSPKGTSLATSFCLLIPCLPFRKQRIHLIMNQTGSERV